MKCNSSGWRSSLRNLMFDSWTWVFVACETWWQHFELTTPWIVSKNVWTVCMLQDYVLIYLSTRGRYLARLNSRATIHGVETSTQLFPGWSVDRSSELLCCAVLCGIVVMRVYNPVNAVAWSAGAPRVTCIEDYEGTCHGVKCKLLAITWGIVGVALLGTVLIVSVLIRVLDAVLLCCAVLCACAGCCVP